MKQKIPVGNGSYVFVEEDYKGKRLTDLALGCGEPGGACYSSASIREKLIPLLSKIAEELDAPRYEPLTFTVKTYDAAKALAAVLGRTSVRTHAVDLGLSVNDPRVVAADDALAEIYNRLTDAVVVAADDALAEIHNRLTDAVQKHGRPG